MIDIVPVEQPENVLVEMPSFKWLNPKTLAEAVQALSADNNAVAMGGGSDMLGFMKDRISGPAVVYPSTIVNLRSIQNLAYIKDDPDGLKIGAATTLADIENSASVQQKAPALAQAAESIASPQIRNVGTLGGNINQRPRCWYFRAGGIGEGAFTCYKRGGDFCFAVTGDNKYHAIIGGELCYIVHPSDSATVLTALKAQARIVGPSGDRLVPFDQYWVTPRQNVLRENVLQRNEILSEVVIPPPAVGQKSTFLKFKERAVFDFAVASVAAVLTLDGAMIKDASVVMGGVAPTPHRSPEAEKSLVGKTLDAATIQAAASAAVASARPLTDNAYKVDLARGLMQQALSALAA